MATSDTCIYASYWDGRKAFENGNPTNPYEKGDEEFGPWADGWYDAFDESDDGSSNG